MKRIYPLILILIISVFGSTLTYSQILNSSFESWNSEVADNWATSNIPGSLTSVSQTSDSHDGSSAVQLEIKSYFGVPFPALLQTQNENASNVGHAVSERYTTIRGYFKLDLKGSAQFQISLAMYDESMQPIAGALISKSNSSVNWSQFEVPIEYINDKVPSFIHLSFAIFDSTGNDQSTLGSSVIIDHITADVATGINQNESIPLSFSLKQNYPNPFNPSTKITYSIKNQSYVTLKVFDALGRELRTLINKEQPVGNYQVEFDASELTSGIYFYRIQAGEFVDTKKMILLR